MTKGLYQGPVLGKNDFKLWIMQKIGRQKWATSNNNTGNKVKAKQTSFKAQH